MRRFFPILRGFVAVGALCWGGPSGAQTVRDIQEMSIGQLEGLDVTSVTKTREALSDAPAAIYVITQEAIARSGAATLPEILRLAPNLQVDQISASRYIITARGFSGNIGDQNFANQLLVLIDGRSVYTPLFSGVYWDMQDVLPDDIERIEVISGPGATLWGANAVNGVINIITKQSVPTRRAAWSRFRPAISNAAPCCNMAAALSDSLAYRFYLRDYMGRGHRTGFGSDGA